MPLKLAARFSLTAGRLAGPVLLGFHARLRPIGPPPPSPSPSPSSRRRRRSPPGRAHPSFGPQLCRNLRGRRSLAFLLDATSEDASGADAGLAGAGDAAEAAVLARHPLLQAGAAGLLQGQELQAHRVPHPQRYHLAFHWSSLPGRPCFTPACKIR